MNVGLSTATLYPKLTEDALDWVVGREFDTAEIFFNTFSEITPDFADKINEIKSGSKTKIQAVHPFTSMIEPFMFFSKYPRRMEDGIELYKRFFDLMNRIDCSILVFHGDFKDNPGTDEYYFEQFAKLIIEGKKHDITVAQENVVRCKAGSIDFVSKMKRHFKDEVKFVLDTKQAVRAGVPPLDMLSAMGENVIHVHISDSDNKRDCLPPGRGGFDFVKIVEMLKALDFDGSLMIELYRDNYNEFDDLISAKQFLENIIR